MATILVVDDDAQIRMILRQLLERAGYTVVEAADGNAAVKVFRQSPTDLVITDIIMPEKEGIETIIELRKERPGVKIIAISGGGRQNPDGYLELASGLGAARTITKPFGRDEILGAVGELLGET